MRLKGILKQRNIGNQWGYVAQISSQAQIFISLTSLFLIAVTAYNTTISPWLIEKGMDIPFWVFLLAMVLGLFIMGLLLYKYAVPSFFSAFNDQFYKHGSQLHDDIEEIKKTNIEIIKRLDGIERK